MSRKPGANASNRVSKCSKEKNHTSAAMIPENASQAPTASPAAELLKTLGIPQADLCRATGMSRATISRLVVHGQWPVYQADLVLEDIEGYLVKRGLTPTQVQRITLALQNKLAPEVSHTPEAVPQVPTETETEKEATMLLQNHELYIETQDHFKLERNPFVDDINSRADVFTSAGTRRVRNAMLNAATQHGFIAVVGESGSGKSTLRKDLEERIRIEKLPIRVIKPYIVQMEPTETRGKPMKSAEIADAIARTLAPGMALKARADSRFEQVHELLCASASAGYSNVIVIEEAHRLPLTTLRHLKGFMELEDGIRRLLGVCLIGQPELSRLLAAENRDIREIVQRCTRVELGPMDADLEAYVQHKFERAGADVRSVLAADAYGAIRAKLIQVARGGNRMNDTRNLCYPLVVNNLLCKAMNFAAQEHWPLVDKQVIAGC